MGCGTSKGQENQVTVKAEVKTDAKKDDIVKVEKKDSPAKDSSAVVAGGEPSPEYVKFKKAFGPLSTKDDASKSQRKEEWGKVDASGNGQCSLAELDAWIQQRLLAVHGASGEELWKRFKACYIRAFSDARDIGKDVQLGTSNCSTDDFVQKRTWRVFIAYLVIYAEMYDAFSLIDGGGAGISADDDRKISLDELKAGVSKLNGFSFSCLQGIDENKVEAVFKDMDADGKGSILLPEWCRYIEQSEQKAATEVGKLLSLGDDDGDE